jgi:hypothetical protein
MQYKSKVRVVLKSTHMKLSRIQYPYRLLVGLRNREAIPQTYNYYFGLPPAGRTAFLMACSVGSIAKQCFQHCKNMSVRPPAFRTVFLILVLLLAGCAPAQTEQAPVIVSTPQPTAGMTATLVPSATITPLPLPTATATLTPTVTPRPVNMELAALRLGDFPAGFEVLDEASQAQLGIKPELLAQLFEGVFHQAAPVTSFAFHNTNAKPFEIVLGVVFYPLTAVEKDQLDRILANPDAMIKDFSHDFNGKSQLNPELNKFGNKSTGWSFTSTSGQSTLKGDMLVLRRENAAGLVMTLGVAGQPSPAAIENLAPLFDQRLRTGLGY